MGDLERTEIYSDINEHLDGIFEIIESGDVDVESDEAFSEIDDFLRRIRAITNEE